MESNLSSVLAFGLPGGTEWVVILVIGLLLFGRRLPEVGKSIGQGIREFKKGLKETEEEVKGDKPASRRASLPQDSTLEPPERTSERAHEHKD
ncbi:MAG: Sec-independent protein translocase subunit TatA/TatB [Phycisphaerales bacterium]